MVATRKKLRSFKATSIAQRWQDKEESQQRKSITSKKNTHNKSKQAYMDKERKISNKESQKKIWDKSVANESLGRTTENIPDRKIKEALKPKIEDHKQLKEASKLKTEAGIKSTETLKWKVDDKKVALKVKKKRNEDQLVRQLNHRRIVSPEKEGKTISRIRKVKRNRKTAKEKMGSEIMKCPECEFTTTHATHFTRHLKRDIYFCNSCEYETDLKCVLFAHEILCQQKRPKVNYEKNLKIISQKGPVYFCEFCQIVCKERLEIVEHVKIEHKFSTPKEIFWCSCCDFETKTKSNLRLHYIFVHKMLSENVKYIADRSFRSPVPIIRRVNNVDLRPNKDGQSEENSLKLKANPTSPNIDSIKKNNQEKKDKYLKMHFNTDIKKDTREDKENKKQQYIQSQLLSLKVAEQHEFQQKLKNKSVIEPTLTQEVPQKIKNESAVKTESKEIINKPTIIKTEVEDALSEKSEGSEKSISEQSERSDGSEIAEIIRVFFQDKAIEISLKRSMSIQKSTAKRKRIEINK